MQIGDRLRQERERLAYTQSTIAKVCEVGFRTYCDYEASKTEPKASFFSAMNCIGADIMYILTGNKRLPTIISIEEQQLIENYRAMDETARKNILEVSNMFTQSKNKIKVSNSQPTCSDNIAHSK